MAQTRGCLARFGTTGLIVLTLALVDVAFLPFWLSSDFATILVYVTMGLGLLPLMVLPTLVVYLNPVLLTLAVRASGVLRPTVAWLLGLCLILATAVGPGVLSRAIEAASTREVPPSFGQPPRAAPQELRMVTSSPTCDDICMRLLFTGDVDALELRVEKGEAAGSTVYRRVDAIPCPPWQGERPPKHLNAFERAGQCLLAEPHATLDAPWVAWTERDLSPSRGPNARRARTLEWGTGATTEGRATLIDRQPITIPTRFTLRTSHTVAVLVARDGVRDRRKLPDVLREVMGYRLPELGVPSDSPMDVIRHYLNQQGPLRDDELAAVSLAASNLKAGVDEDLVHRLLTDPRMGSVFGRLALVAAKRPEVFVPHVERLVAIVEEDQRPRTDRAKVAELLAVLPPGDLEAMGPRIVALARPPLAEAPVQKPLLFIVGRLGVDPSPALGPALASDREDVLIAAAGGLCNADSRWAPPHLDAAQRALEAGHSFAASKRLARGLLRHGRPEPVERYLRSLPDAEQRRLRKDVERDWGSPPGGCWP